MFHPSSLRPALFILMSSFGPKFGDEQLGVVASTPSVSKKRKGVSGEQAHGSGAAASTGQGKLLHQAILSLSAKVRDLQACSIRAAVIDSDHRSVKYMLSAQKQYADAVKGNKGHNCSTPDWWSFCGLAKAMHEDATSEASKKVAAELLALVDQEAGVRNLVRLCRCAPAWAEGKHRVEFNLGGSQYENFVVVYFEELAAADMKYGRPPRTT